MRLLFLIFWSCLGERRLSIEASSVDSEVTAPVETEEPVLETDTSLELDEGDDPQPIPALSLTLTEVFQPQDANIWNGFAPLDDGFVFTTMSQGALTIRHYDSAFYKTFGPVDIADATDLQSQGIIADHAILREGNSLYVTFSDSGADDLYLVKTDLQGVRQAFVAIEVDGPYRTNDPHIVSDGEKVCIRYGRDGDEKTVHCRTLDLSEAVIDKVVATPVFTGNLGTTVFHDGEFRCFGGALLPSGAVGLELMMTRYDADWSVLDPFETPVVESVSGEWHWASSGVTWIPEHAVWAIAYTTMPADGQADFDSRGRLALFTADFQLVERVEFGDQAVHRPHVIWRAPELILSYDAGPVTIRRYQLDVD